MRQRTMWWLVAVVGAGCSSDPAPVDFIDDDSGAPGDLGSAGADVVDAGRPGVLDAGRADVPDAPPGTDLGSAAASVATVRAAIVGTAPVTLSAALVDLVVTQTVGATPGTDGGVSTNDPAGFFVQSAMTGPALFVAVDPASLSPAPQSGDRVSFTVTRGELRAGARWVTALSGYRRTGTGADRGALRQDVSGAADLVAFGRPYMANPDLVERFRHGWPLADLPDMAYWWTPQGARGYTDFPSHAPGTA